MPTTDGATPIDADEAAALIPTHIATQAQLNEWEQANVQAAATWLTRAVLPPWRGASRHDVLTERFVRTLHKRMFDRTWKWAGTFRKTEKNIGVAPERIAIDLRNLLDDVRYWIEHVTYPVDEIGARFHHRLVEIHPFANGNGRHSRLMTDVLLHTRGAMPFSWGSGADLVTVGDARDRYLAALRSADAGDYALLLRFVHS